MNEHYLERKEEELSRSEQFKRSLSKAIDKLSVPLKSKAVMFSLAVTLAGGLLSGGKPENTMLSNIGTNNTPRSNVENVHPPVIEGECVVLKSGNNGVNIRLGPGTEFSKVDIAGSTSLMTYTGNVTQEGWYEILLNDGTQAYISGQFAERVSCEEGVDNILEANPRLHYLSKTVITGEVGDLTIFGLENLESYGYDFPTELIYAIHQVIEEVAPQYFPGVSSNLPTAIIFSSEEEVLNLAPNGRAAVQRSEQLTGEDTYLRGVYEEVTFTGNFLSPYGFANGEVYNGVFVSLDRTKGSGDLAMILAHEKTHEAGSYATAHSEVWNERKQRWELDYSYKNSAVHFEMVAGTAFSAAIDDTLNECFYTLDEDLCNRFKVAFQEVLSTEREEQEITVTSLDSNSSSISLPLEDISVTVPGQDGQPVKLFEGFKYNGQVFDKNMLPFNGIEQ